MQNISEQSKKNREFMKVGSFVDVMQNSDQAKGLIHPEHSTKRGGEIIQLPSFENAITTPNYLDLLDKRRSVREHSEKPITQGQLAFLLWSMNGVQDFRGETKAHTLRPAPSGGARHSLEVYFAALNVEGLEPALYHYLPLENVGEKRVAIEKIADLPSDDLLSKMLVGQDWTLKAGALFFVSTVPYRGEWRYDSLAHRMILSDLGYAGQNFMLSATSMGLGSCQMAGYSQKLCDEILGLDGVDEFTIIAMSAGTV